MPSMLWRIFRGCDFHVCIDGCFSHRRLKHAGNPAHPHIPEHYVSKQEVDAVGEHIAKVRKKPAKARKAVVPDEAIDECEDGHIAGTGTKTKTDPERYDDTGTMALLCRHDIPLLLANIDTPGEQQKYAVALIKKLYSMLPPTATVAVFYDVGCVLDRSLQLRNRRLWLIDRLTARIAADSRDHLGVWIIRRNNDLDNRTAKHKLQMQQCGIPESELRQLWQEQREAQLSVRAHAPAKLKKDLDKLLTIQGDLDRIESSIKEATSALGNGRQTASPLKDLTALYEPLAAKLDDLYASLNIVDSFPALKGLPFDVVQKLLLARDLKINIRKRAIGSFFENERLEQASGGRNQALGTKEHQRVRTAIEKRKPSFLSAIRRFNKLCAELKELLKPEWNIPAPDTLPTDIHKLRTQSHIMEDVWIERSIGKTPRWIESPEVREGIRAMLSLDRCREERLRLGREADNMCRWFGAELAQTEIAIVDPKNAHIRRQLEAYHTRLLLTEPKWSSSPLVSKLRYQHHVTAAQQQAQRFSGTLNSQTVWLPVVTHDLTATAITFDCTSFADETHDGVTGVTDGYCEPSTDADTADLPDVGELQLQEILEEQAEDAAAEDESALENVYWTLPTSLLVDGILIDSLRSPYIRDAPNHHRSRKLNSYEHKHNRVIEFCPQALDRLSQPSERLNDVCVNSGALLLQHIFTHERFSPPQAQMCAIFSSFHIHLARYDHSIDEVWRRSMSTAYWEKSAWLIPIHREQPFKHWVLCVIYPLHGCLYVYDSLASDISSWKDEIKEVKLLVAKLKLAAIKNERSFEVQDKCPLYILNRMTRTGTAEERKFADVAAVFYKQAMLDGAQDQFLRAFMKIFFRKFPERAPSAFTEAQIAEARRCRRAGIPFEPDRTCRDPAFDYVRLIVKDMDWQCHAWSKYTIKMDWKEWISLSDRSRDSISDLIYTKYRRWQRELKTKSLDALFGVPGSCVEHAIVVDGDND
ncbi:hypothetical protein MD484_g2717, partial [Candolleomyces efflorescens]